MSQLHFRHARSLTFALVGPFASLQILAQVPPPPAPPAQPDIAGINADSFYGKEPTEGVYVRDSAGAVEKLALAQKMERLKEWNKSADLYQEVIVKYADRVVPSQLDADKKIYQYTSITNPVQERLAHWPEEGLDVYRARFETPAQSLLDNARPDDVSALNKVYSLYFVTEAGKQAGIRLIDLYLESGEYPAAAWLGERLLTLHPGLQTERPAVLYRTALAYYYSGDRDKAKARLDQFKAKFANERGMVRGKEVVLADSLAQEMLAPVSGSQSASADSWPIPWGDPSRSRVSTAEGRPGARLYGIPLARPNWPSNPAQKDALQKQYEESIQEGRTLGILPVTDRGELYFQDGTRLYGLSIESGVPIPAWSQTYPDGFYTLPGVWGSPRAHQLSVALTEHEVLAIMGQPDTGAALVGQPITGEPRLVCLDRQNGKEKWVLSLSQLPDSAKESRALIMSGSPLVVGDSVLVIARGAKTQFEDCYVLSFDLPTGKYRWSTYIASASANVAMWGGMNGISPQGDNASHLAYANGRVFVQTNLGALAALDAYSGAVAWLDIYPTGRQALERQQFNPFGAGNQIQTPAHKPWAYNPVVVEDGRVFSLPTEGRNLLIYDAASGTEVKKIDVKDIETKESGLSNLDTLVGVVGDKILLAGDKGMIYLNWKNYTREAFDPEHDNITIWPYVFPQPIRGRAFIAHDTVFVPCQDRLYCVSLKLGKSIAEYPKHPPSGIGGDWEDPEEPGNILTTNDHVIVAGAKMLNVYTDLLLARQKLDRELADNPNDPQPRLRYAEVMFVAGETDLSITKLDEAAGLLGGLKALAPGLNRDRLFNDSLTFADKLSRSKHDEDRDRAVKLYDRAASAASTPVQQVHYRMSRARFVESQKDYVAAITLYQEILADKAMRPVPMTSEGANAPTQAEGAASRAIAAIIKDHPAAYESFQQAATAAMDEVLATKDPANKLLDIARTYPNSTVAGKAMIAAAEAYETAGDSRHAVRVLRDMWFKYADSPDKARIQESIARNYLTMSAAPRESAGDHGPMDNIEAAATALARAAAVPGDPKLEKALKLRDGTSIEAGTPISQALDVVRKYRDQATYKALPNLNIPVLNIPVPPPRVPGKPRAPHPKAFAPMDKERDIIANIKTLVLPIRDFDRPDRVVAFGIDGTLNIYPAGQTKPLSTGHAFADEPKQCAWVGNSVLVWSGSQIVNIKAETGEAAWKIDLRDMAPIEVVRVGDSAQNIVGRPADPNVLVVNGVQQVRVRVGQRVVFRPVNMRNGVAPAPIPARPASAVEEIIEVRPVGEHVLLTTTSGRILSAELTSGHIAWQTRLSDRPVDRLLANDDFAVVRVSDETAVRIAAFDTATGQMRCTRSWVVQSGMVPVNLALAADGTLVYTMPDRLCLKDLYKPWPDSTDKEVQANPGISLFQKADQPDQLLIAEGRILALADDGTIKYVRVHSLETGQPVPLRYHSAQGEQDIDRILKAGKSDQVNLRVVGPHLYVINPYGVISYNLDRPAETWDSPLDLDNPKPTVKESFIDQQYLVLLNEPPAPDDAGAPIPVGLAPVPPPVVPAPAQPAAGNANVAPAQPNGAPAMPSHEYRLQIFGRYPVSDRNPAESGRLDYLQTVSDPAGILPSWQAADGAFYYVTADSKLHLLRGSKK